VCTGMVGKTPGTCKKTNDGGDGIDTTASVDGGLAIDMVVPVDGAVVPLDGALGIDTTSNVDTNHPVDGTALAFDSSIPSIDAPATCDLGSTVDSPLSPDAVPDMPITPDLLGDVATDSMADTTRDLAASPDTGPGCTIGGTFYPSGVANVENPCQTCQPSFSTTGWTVGGNGTSCGPGQVCSAGTCQAGCWIGGGLVASGAANQANSCQICKPSALTTNWSNNPDGASCGDSQICGSGTCQSACFIDGNIFASGTTNTSNPCQKCNPAISTTAWAQTRSDCAAISAGSGFTCVAIGGTAKCWGAYGSDTSSRVPGQVTGLHSSVQGIMASTGGGGHACALVSGGVQCWGQNTKGQLGNNTNTRSYIPVQVTGLTIGVLGISGGFDHSCALVEGGIQCWGNGQFGRLGNGADTTSWVPVSVQSFAGTAHMIAAGGRHNCALSTAGVQCWGGNESGELGDNSTEARLTPVTVQGLSSGIQAIVAGRTHTCALVNGSVQCWGGNYYGQLGNNSTTESHIPVTVQGLPSGVQAISANDLHTCALAGGGVWCWGDNSSSQLGYDSATEYFLTAVPVPGLPNGVQAIAAGQNHTCALVSGGAWCWGSNSVGQLGNNSTTNSATPVQVQGL
jgi:alpha-tubulin suppressor-like RCC1 family protein